MPDPSTLALLSFSLQVINALLLPAVVGLGRYLLRMDRRLLTIELHLGLNKRVSDL